MLATPRAAPGFPKPGTNDAPDGATPLSLLSPVPGRGLWISPRNPSHSKNGQPRGPTRPAPRAVAAATRGQRRDFIERAVRRPFTSWCPRYARVRRSREQPVPSRDCTFRRSCRLRRWSPRQPHPCPHREGYDTESNPSSRPGRGRRGLDSGRHRPPHLQVARRTSRERGRSLVGVGCSPTSKAMTSVHAALTMRLPSDCAARAME